MGQYEGKRKIWPQKVKGPICRVIDRPVPELLACSFDVVDIIDIIDVVDVVDEGCEIL